MERYYKKIRKSVSSSSNESNVNASVDQVKTEVNLGDFNSDVGSRKSVYDYDVVIRYEEQSDYLTTGLCQPIGSELDVVYCTRLSEVLSVARTLLKMGELYESTTSHVRDNFIALLDLCSRNLCSKNSKRISRVLSQNAPKKNQITSRKIQKELAHACASEVTRAIVKDIGDSFFALLVDEARDISMKELKGVVLRYVNKEGCVIERFLGIMNVPDTDSETMKDVIDSFFAQHGLSLSKLRGQGYNGAADMRGDFNEMKLSILQENPYAMYAHCFSHQFQSVVIVVAQGVFPIWQLFTHVSMIVNTIEASSKYRDQFRQLEHEKLGTELSRGEGGGNHGGNQETSTVRSADTRWGSICLTLDHLCSMWPSVEQVLETVLDVDIDPHDRCTANRCLDIMYEYRFVFVLHLMKYILGITNELSLSLQQKDLDIVHVISLVQNVKHQLQRFREDGWEIILDQARRFCELNDIPLIDMEDTMTRPGYKRHGAPVITNLYYYRVEVFNQAIDLTVEEINDHFSEASVELLSCIACFDPRNSFSQFNVDQLMRLTALYGDDFSTEDCLCLRQQLSNFIVNVRCDSHFSSTSNLENLAQNMVKTGRHLAFPLVYRMIELMLVLPVVTPSVERAISAMKTVKTDLQEQTGDELRNDSLVVYIENDIFSTIDDEQILQRFHFLKAQASTAITSPSVIS